MQSVATKLDTRFTYRDYAQWPDEERWELIEGVPYCFSPSPSREHQRILRELTLQIAAFLDDKPCEMFQAPLDVRLLEDGDIDGDETTVVQPDIIIVCDEDKLDERGCRGAPDFCAEILSPSTAYRDQTLKTDVYERHGVREFWTVHPAERLVTVRVLGDDGNFAAPVIHEARGRLPLAILPELAIDLEKIFGPEPEDWGRNVVPPPLRDKGPSQG